MNRYLEALLALVLIMPFVIVPAYVCTYLLARSGILDLSKDDEAD